MIDKKNIDILESSISKQEIRVDIKRHFFVISSFHLTISCFILAFATDGLGFTFLGLPLFTTISTLFIYLALMIQIATHNIRLPKILAIVFAYIFIQTFIVNAFTISFFSSFKTFIGLILFSISIFSFVSVYRNRIVEIIRIYFRYVFIIACLGILQSILFLFFKISFIPQNIISGTLVVGGRNFFLPEIFGILPRAVGLSSEPASYAIGILPGVYIALLILTGKVSLLGIYERFMSKIILIGFILSFSIVGYFGLLLCLLSIFTNKFKANLLANVSIILFFVGALYVISQTTLMSKVTTLPTMISGASDYEFESSDLTGFALVSNVAVAREGLIKSHYLGTGLNTHKDTYDQIIYKIFSKSQVILELNREDAGSLFIRLASEFGIPGIMLFLFFLYRYRLGKDCSTSITKYINGMCLVSIISFSVRNGSYLSVFFFFFLALYYYTYIVQQNNLKTIDS